MSADLIIDYYKRDLDAAEEEQLAQLLQASPEAAERFAALAAEDYRGFGLPEPAGGASRGAVRKSLLLFALGVGLVTAATVVWKGKPQESRVAVIAEDGGSAFDVVERPEPAARPAAAETASAPAEAPRLFVQAQTPRGPFDIRVSGAKAEAVGVFDAQGRLVADLITLDSHRFRWDGRKEGGVPAGAGPYQLRLDAAGRTLKQWVEIEVR